MNDAIKMFRLRQEAFVNAAFALARAWEKVDDHDFADGYPFEKDFNELILDISEWGHRSMRAVDPIHFITGDPRSCPQEVAGKLPGIGLIYRPRRIGGIDEVTCPTCRSRIIYAANLGAGGIDYRCATHLEEVLTDPDNLAAGVTRDDYVPADPDDADAACEACNGEENDA